MNQVKQTNWRSLGLEFFSIFIAVVSAFALNNWNENRRDAEAASKIIAEISNGLEKDQEDIRVNMLGHEAGIRACQFWREIVQGQDVSTDTVMAHFSNLTRDFISIQNVSGYETLKSRGLELIEDDSLRRDIIALYEYDYKILKNFEEEYHEMQYQENYFQVINGMIAPNLMFDPRGNIVGFERPLKWSASEQKIFLSYLWKIEMNRRFLLSYYGQTKEKVQQLQEQIKGQLGSWC